MKTLVIIPTRLESKRLPNKPLIDIQGKPLIEVVYSYVRKVFNYDEVIISTDSKQIQKAVSKFARCVITPKECDNGTHRCYETLKLISDEPEYIINVQGDEIIVSSHILLQIKEFLEKGVPLLTASKVITDTTKFNNTDVVKVVSDYKGKPLYFSRYLPYGKEHLGIYGYRTDIMPILTSLPKQTIEAIENLEQMRWIQNNIQPIMLTVDGESYSINNYKDVKQLNNVTYGKLI